MKKLIVMDLDDTLLRPDKSISERTIRTLAATREKGHLLAFATARSEKASQRAARLVDPNFMITCGGALVKHKNGNILKSVVLSAETAREVILFCKSLPSIGLISAETENLRYLVGTKDEPHFAGDYSHAQKFDFSNSLPCGVYKLVIQIQKEEDKEKVKQNFPELTIFSYTGSTAVFMAAPGVGKWNGLKTVAHSLNIASSDIIAFGDDISDAEMLQKSGIGVAMGNAVPFTKDVANQICANSADDGLALWIEENLI